MLSETIQLLDKAVESLKEHIVDTNIIFDVACLSGSLKCVGPDKNHLLFVLGEELELIYEVGMARGVLRALLSNIANYVDTLSAQQDEFCLPDVMLEKNSFTESYVEVPSHLNRQSLQFYLGLLQDAEENTLAKGIRKVNAYGFECVVEYFQNGKKIPLYIQTSNGNGHEYSLSIKKLLIEG